MAFDKLTAQYAEWSAEAISLQIPDLQLPFAPPLHDYTQASLVADDAASLETELAAWVERYYLADPAVILSHNYGSLTTMSFPLASPEITLAIGKIFVFGFIVDDLELEPQTGRDPVHFHQCLLQLDDVLTNPDCSVAKTSGLVKALANLTETIERVASPEVAVRVNGGWARYFLGTACEHGYLSTGTLPTPDDYLRIRLATLTDYASHCAQLAENVALPAAVLNHPDTRRLVAAVQRMIGYSNDLLTCRAELLRPGMCVNMPIVLAHHHNISLQQAVNHTTQLLHAATADFVRVAELLRDGALQPQSARQAPTNDPLTIYIQRLTQAVRGFQDWTTHNVRYATADPKPQSTLADDL